MTADGAAATAGCLGDDQESSDGPTVFVFNTGDGTVSLIAPETNEIVGTPHLGLSSSFPSNQYMTQSTTATEDRLFELIELGEDVLDVDDITPVSPIVGPTHG